MQAPRHFFLQLEMAAHQSHVFSDHEIKIPHRDPAARPFAAAPAEIGCQPLGPVGHFGTHLAFTQRLVWGGGGGCRRGRGCPRCAHAMEGEPAGKQRGKDGEAGLQAGGT